MCHELDSRSVNRTRVKRGSALAGTHRLEGVAMNVVGVPGPTSPAFIHCACAANNYVALRRCARDKRGASHGLFSVLAQK